MFSRKVEGDEFEVCDVMTADHAKGRSNIFETNFSPNFIETPPTSLYASLNEGVFTLENQTAFNIDKTTGPQEGCRSRKIWFGIEHDWSFANERLYLHVVFLLILAILFAFFSACTTILTPARLRAPITAPSVILHAVEFCFSRLADWLMSLVWRDHTRDDRLVKGVAGHSRWVMTENTHLDGLFSDLQFIELAFTEIANNRT